jgi:hypothetical protein
MGHVWLCFFTQHGGMTRDKGANMDIEPDELVCLPLSVGHEYGVVCIPTYLLTQDHHTNLVQIRE